MKLVCYLQCGLGDFYTLLSVLPDYIEKRDIRQEDVTFYVDSIYFHEPQFQFEKAAAIDMMETITKNWHVVPKDLGSYHDMYYDDQKERITGPIYSKIYDKFMFYRRKETADFMRSKIGKSTRFVYAIMSEFLYEWRDGVNVQILKSMNLERRPLNFWGESDKKWMEKEMAGKCIIHKRKKGLAETEQYFNSIIQHVKDIGLDPLIIGPDAPKPSNFKGIMCALEYAPYAILSSSVFAYHRVHFNKETIISTPERLGQNTSIFPKEYFSKYIFLNGDSDILPDLVKLVASKWTWELRICLGMGESGKTSYAKSLEGYMHTKFDNLKPYGSKEAFYGVLKDVAAHLNLEHGGSYVMDGYVYPFEGEILGKGFEYLRGILSNSYKIKPVVIVERADIIVERVQKRGSPDKVDRDFVIKLYEQIGESFNLSEAEFYWATEGEFKPVPDFPTAMRIIRGEHGL